MVGVMKPKALPQGEEVQQKEKYLCSASILNNYSLKLANGEVEKANFTKISFPEQIIEIEGKKVKEVYAENGEYYYYSQKEKGMKRAAMGQIFKIDGKQALVQDANVKDYSHYLSRITMPSNENFVIGNHIVDRFYVVARAEGKLNTKVGEIFVPIEGGKLKKLGKDTPIYYMQNPVVSVRDMGKPIRVGSESEFLGPTMTNIYPSPCTGNSVAIDFKLPEPGVVSIRIYNLQGEEVRTPIQREHLDNGKYSINVDLGGLDSGNYFVKIHNEDGDVQVKKLIVEH